MEVSIELAPANAGRALYVPYAMDAASGRTTTLHHNTKQVWPINWKVVEASALKR